MALPVRVTREQFDAAIAQFKTVIGEEWAFTEEEDILLYRDAYSPLFGEEIELMASAAVAPAST